MRESAGHIDESDSRAMNCDRDGMHRFARQREVGSTQISRQEELFGRPATRDADQPMRDKSPRTFGDQD